MNLGCNLPRFTTGSSLGFNLEKSLSLNKKLHYLLLQNIQNFLLSWQINHLCGLFLRHSGLISFVKITSKLQAFNITFLCPWYYKHAPRTSYTCPERSFRVYVEDNAWFEQSAFPDVLPWATVSFASTPGNLKRQHCLLLIKDGDLRNYLKFLACVKPKSSMKRKSLGVASVQICYDASS